MGRRRGFHGVNPSVYSCFTNFFLEMEMYSASAAGGSCAALVKIMKFEIAMLNVNFVQRLALFVSSSLLFFPNEITAKTSVTDQFLFFFFFFFFFHLVFAQTRLQIPKSKQTHLKINFAAGGSKQAGIPKSSVVTCEPCFARHP